MHKLKRKIAMLVACVILAQAVLPVETVQAAVDDETVVNWQLHPKGVTTDGVITFHKAKSDKVHTYFYWGKDSIGKAERWSLEFGEYDGSNWFRAYYYKENALNTISPVKDWKATVIKQESALSDLYELYELYTKDKHVDGLSYNDLPLSSQGSVLLGSTKLGDALKDIASSRKWISNTYLRNSVPDGKKTILGSDTGTVGKYYKSYKTSDANSSDPDVKSVFNFYAKMKKKPEYLKPLVWWYNHYAADKNHQIDGSDGNYSVSDKFKIENDVQRFVVYCVQGYPMDPAEAAKQLEADREDAIQGAADAKDVNKFEDWCRAMAYIHEGVEKGTKYSDKFLDFKNVPDSFTSYQKGQIATILELPNSKQKVDVAHVSSLTSYFSANDAKGKYVVDACKETREAALAELKSLGEEDYQDWTTRMVTFEARVKYLVCTAYDGTEVDEAVAKFYTDPNKNLILNPDISYMDIGSGSLIGGPFTVKNTTAYTYLVSTLTELYSISRDVPNTVLGFISNNTISSKKVYIEGMTSMYNALRLIDSKQAWELWSTPFDSNTASLQEVYDQLVAMGAFDGLDTSTTLQTGRPLGTFMDMDSDILAPMYLKGIAYSATYVPMYTNVYDAYTLAAYDDEFLNDFHYRYGFYRKALYIDTNASAAVDLHNTGRKGETRVCTLKDLLQCEKDIVLYIDDNFYNVNQLAEMLDKSFDRLDNVDGKTDDRPWYNKLWDKVTDYFTVDIYEQTKTAEQTQYSAKLYKKVQSQNTPGYIPDASSSSDNEDQLVLTSSQINDYLDGITKIRRKNPDTGEEYDSLNYDAYTPLLAYSVVSAIYRDPTFFTKANSASVGDPVFISSADLAAVSNTSDYEKSSILNYALLKNLEANIPVGYNYNLDMYAPVYMDIYGNILTESGVVVVPAACNMTLFKDGYCKDLYNVGLFTVYGDDYSIPTSYEGIDSIMDNAFEKDEDLNVWKVKSRTVDGEVADYARLATGDRAVAEAIQKQFEYDLSEGIELYQFERFFNICVETLRGAPIESIDKDFEGLNTNRRLSKAGLVAAAKLEELQTSLASNDANSILSLPNLAFLDGLEYIVVFLFKLLTFIVILVMMITVYIDAVGTQFSWRTFLKCFWVVVLTVCTVVTIPTVFQLTYYQSNRALLQDETAYVAMLNLEKRESGVEVGVYDVDVPDISTKLLIKLEDINVPWYDVFQNVMLSSTFNNLEELYDSYANDVPSSLQEDVTVMNDGVYMYTDTLFDSADVNVNLGTQELYMRTDETLTASFYSPYYAVLEALVTRVNEYNTENNWYAYSTKIQKGGKLKTVGLITPYFTSADFMDSEGDLLDMCRLHRVNASMDDTYVFTDTEIETMQQSLWTNTVLSDEQTYKRTDKLSDYMREFVATNRNLLGKISDETFLKVMALSIAMEHNKLFGVTSADCYEIYNLSNDDLLRLSIADRDTVMINSTLTFSRFVYEVGGTPAVYAAAILTMITWISSYVKPLCTILVFVAIFISLFVFKICLRKKSANLYGYAITTILLCGCNLLHSILLKSCMYLPILHLPATVCIILQCLLQLGYMAILGYVTIVAFRDWQDLGFERHQANAQKLAHSMTPKFFRRQGDNQYRTSFESRNSRPKNNWEYYDRLVDKHKERNRRIQ